MKTDNLANKAKAVARFKQHPYISQDMEVSVDIYPFPHISIKNLFADDIYNGMCEKFGTYASRVPATGERADGYGAKIYGLTPEDCQRGGYEFLASRIWKQFIQVMFDIYFNEQIANQIHVHDVPSQSGWIHRDCQICVGSNAKKLQGVDKILLLNNKQHIEYGKDNDNILKYREQPAAFPKIARSVSGIYYLNNHEEAGKTLKGGGTGLFKKNDIHTLDTVKEPVNNSMLLFECGVDSYHTYIGTEEFTRCSFVQWFHEDVDKHLTRKREDIEKSGLSIHEYFDRWEDTTPWFYHGDYPWKK